MSAARLGPRSLQTRDGKSPASSVEHMARKAHMLPPPIENKPKPSSRWSYLLAKANEAELSILDFFHRETRAIEDGVPFGGTNESVSILAERLANRIAQCHDGGKRIPNTRANKLDTKCVLRVVFVGSGQMSGRDIFHNQSFPFQAEQRLQSVADAAGLRMEVLNQAIDSDLSREGPQTAHMCMGNLVGSDSPVDVIAWDFESTMQGKPQAQVEAFVRWVSAGLQPAMIMFNRPGPHAHSRRGKPRVVVNLVGSHDAILWEDDPEDMPEMQQEPYRNSSIFNELWNNDRNFFWEPIIQKYSSFVDFAAIDPVSILLQHVLPMRKRCFCCSGFLTVSTLS